MAIWYARNVANTNGTWGAANSLTQAGAQGSASGSLGVFSGNSTGTVEQPVVRYFCASVFNADGTNAANGITVYLMGLDGSRKALYPNGAVTVNHPVGHPTQAGNSGWICFNHTSIPSEQVNHVLMVLDQNGTAGVETGVSIPVTPQLTNNGNG